MTNRRNSWRVALSVAAMLVAAQIAVSLSVRTHRFHNYLSAHLEKAFGRPVVVKRFNIEILPSPRIYAAGVTIGEDPAFGYEYFLRAEHLTAGLRWAGFLRGHFEFGTLSLSQTSLNLVRNSEGRWNLEGWLPPAKKMAEKDFRVYGPSPAPAIANRLERIEFDDGRINFKSAEIKPPFALTGVSGSVEQVSRGRWKLQLEAQPWRSGVALQSTGTMKVRGDLAGTSARLQPASLTVQWDRVSLADLFRLLRGQDYGMRGTFALEATAKSGGPFGSAASPESPNDAVVAPLRGLTQATAGPSSSGDSADGDWMFSLKASAAQIHRWDLTERPDNPKLTASLQGRWNVALGKITAESLLVETPVSNLHGTARFGSAAMPFMEVKIGKAGIQAVDILAWYRAFHPGVADGITADEFFSGTLTLQGWPLKLEQMTFSTLGGVVNVRGVDESLKVGAFRGGLDRSKLVMDPVRLSFLSALSPASPPGRLATATKHRASDETSGEVNLALTHDFVTHAGAMGIQGQVDRAESVLKLATAFGHPFNHGWDLTGPARADLRREWSLSSHGIWNGDIAVSKAQLAAAGLNQAVQLQQARLEWRDGKRSAQIGQAEGFGATWSGNVAEDTSADPQREGTWNVQLHADHLNAAELDRWVGPRARPGWLQRLLPSLLGGPAQTGPASELVRRLNVAGDLLVDEFTIEKLKLEQLHVQGALHDLQLDIFAGHAQWAGGTVRAAMNARFLPRPVYDVKAELNGVELTQLPIAASASDRLGGVASGTLRLKTTGVGREELLQKLTGTGEMHLANLEFRGWDVNASVADGEAHAGISRWTTGDGAFTIRDRGVILEDVRLNGLAETTIVNGSVSFGRDANLAVETSAGKRALRNTGASGHVLKIVGPLDGPRVSGNKSTPRQPAD